MVTPDPEVGAGPEPAQPETIQPMSPKESKMIEEPEKILQDQVVDN